MACAFAWVPVSGAIAQDDDEPSVAIHQYYAPRVAHVQTVGELYTGVREPAGSGSGFLIGDHLILTNNHVVPDVAALYRTVTVNVRIGSRGADARAGTVIARDSELDLALVDISPAAAPEPFCPVSPLAGEARTPPGSRVYVMGFPLDEEASIIDGLLSNHTSARRWQTSAVLVVGYSGGPVFSSRGYMIGIALGGITRFSMGDEETQVVGVNYFIPSVSIAASPIGEAIAARVGADCWALASLMPDRSRRPWSDGPPVQVAMADIPRGPQSVAGENLAAGPPERGVPLDMPVTARDAAEPFRAAGEWTIPPPAAVVPGDAAAPSPPEPMAPVFPDPPPSPPAAEAERAVQASPAPALFSRGFSVSSVKDDHPILLAAHSRNYSEEFRAAPGHRIENCSFAALSENHASHVVCVIAPNGRSARLTWRLQSGPAYDRWRGWLHGSVTLRQRADP